MFLYFLSAALLVAEVFVPSFGLISVCAISSLVGGILIFFNHSPTAGWAGIVIAVLMIPGVLIGAYRLFPKTRFGRAVSLAGPVRQAGDAVPDTEQIKQLLGKKGVVITPLRPVGMCEISGSRVECVAESGYVDKGKTVEVIGVEETQITVRVIE